MKKILPLVVSLLFAAPSFADDDDDRHERRGPKTRYENNAEHYKYEYKDRRCKYEYKYSYRTGKTKVEQKGDCRHVAMVHPVAYEPLPRAIPPAPEVRVVQCNRDVLGAILGGAVGAAVGSRIGDRDDRVITTVGGAVIGAVVGGAIGRSMDEADQACAAQALEYGHLKQTVAWKSARGASYTITPTGSHKDCRNYLLKGTEGGRPVEHAGRACRRKDGAWVFVS